MVDTMYLDQKKNNMSWTPYAFFINICFMVDTMYLDKKN